MVELSCDNIAEFLVFSPSLADVMHNASYRKQCAMIVLQHKYIFYINIHNTKKSSCCFLFGSPKISCFIRIICYTNNCEPSASKLGLVCQQKIYELGLFLISCSISCSIFAPTVHEVFLNSIV